MRKSGFVPILASAVLIAASSAQAADTHAPLIDPARITVSGMSAGGAMANQLHVAYADVFSGAGVLAGVPYGCAEGSLATAMARCMGKADGSLSSQALAADLRTAFTAGHIANPELLRNDPVWLFHGTQDFVVAQAVSDVLYYLYLDFIPEKQLAYINEVVAAHTFPANGTGNSCTEPKTPFVGDCSYDAAGELLKHLYPGLVIPALEVTTKLQPVKLPGAAEAGLSEDAFLFTPPACLQGDEKCALHVVLHGCLQSATQVGEEFIRQSGYLPWAETNNIVLAFPQVVAGATNPYACWDWWGYTGENYRWRDGAQAKVVSDWVIAMLGN